MTLTLPQYQNFTTLRQLYSLSNPDIYENALVKSSPCVVRIMGLVFLLSHKTKKFLLRLIGFGNQYYTSDADMQIIKI